MCRRSEVKRRREPLRKNTPRTISIALLTLYSINQSQEIAHRMQTLDKPSFSPFLFQTSLLVYTRINRIERNTDSPLVESTWAKYGNKFTRSDECMAEQVLRKSNTKPRLSRAEAVSVSKYSISTSRFVFPQTGGGARTLTRGKRVRPSTSTGEHKRSRCRSRVYSGGPIRGTMGRQVCPVTTQGRLRTALIHANTSRTERAVFVFVSWPWRLRDPKLFETREIS